MKFAQRVFFIAGLYGLALLVPMYFLEDTVGRQDPPPITHPEYFYGFVGVAVVAQFFYLMIGHDPLRYRPMMLIAMLAKAAFGIAVMVLFAKGRVSGGPVYGASLDLFFGGLFGCAYVATGKVAEAKGLETPARSDS